MNETQSELLPNPDQVTRKDIEKLVAFLQPDSAFTQSEQVQAGIHQAVRSLEQETPDITQGHT